MNFNPADYFVHTLAIVPGDEENCKDRVKVHEAEPLNRVTVSAYHTTVVHTNCPTLLHVARIFLTFNSAVCDWWYCCYLKLSCYSSLQVTQSVFEVAKAICT